MMEILGLYMVVAFFVTLACIGHLMGCKRKMHALDILLISVLIGTLWVLIPWIIRSQ